MEPALTCTSALYSQATGIIDSHAFMVALQGDAENAGAVPVFFSPVLGGRAVNRGIEIDVGGADPMPLRCRLLVNFCRTACAEAGGPHHRHAARPCSNGILCKGQLFHSIGPLAVFALDLSVPVPGGLGVHLTIDLGGQARFGPDVQWIDEIDYTVDPARSDGFYDAVRILAWPEGW